eukprot:Gb_02811 [translate_table: standard]
MSTRLHFPHPSIPLQVLRLLLSAQSQEMFSFALRNPPYLEASYGLPPSLHPHTFKSPSTRCSLEVGVPMGNNLMSKSRNGRRSSILRSSTNESLSTMPTTLEEDRQTEESAVPEDRKKALKVRHLTEIWREVQGSNNWEGMLDPMNPILREEIIRYGEFAQACYDAFDFDPFSKYCGSCKYHRRRYFENVGMSDYGYEITRYLYATSNINLSKFFRKSRSPKMWSSHANWMGVVAVTTDEKEIERLGRRDIVVAWRGTVTYLEWIADLMDFLKPAGLNVIDPDPDVKVESGFLNLYTAKESDCRFCKASAREQIHTEIKRLVDKYKGEELSITITGHSLGSALAMLSAYDLAETGINVRSTSDVNVRDKEASKIPITVFSFAGPRVGNSRFKERCEELGLKILRVVNVHDSVPKVPGILFNEKFQMLREWIDKLPWSYSHVGVELALDHKHSPFLKPNADPSCYHNLEAHLHMLDGYHGRGRRFFLASGRDPALVNKACDFLKDHHLVPPHWRQDENKGLLKNHEGRWIQPERSRVDEVPSDTLHMTTPNVGAHPPKKSSVQS